VLDMGSGMPHTLVMPADNATVILDTTDPDFNDDDEVVDPADPYRMSELIPPTYRARPAEPEVTALDARIARQAIDASFKLDSFERQLTRTARPAGGQR